MFVVDSSTGAITSREGRHEVESVYLMQEDGFLCSIEGESPTENDYLNGSVFFTRPFLSFDRDLLQFIATPLSTTEEVYTASLPGAQVALSNDLYMLAEKLGSVSLNQRAIEHIQLKGLPPAEQTIFEGIERLLPRGVAKLSTQGVSFFKTPFSKLGPFRDDREAYALFKDSLVGTLAHEASGLDEIGLMFSGGADSTLLGLVFERLLKKRVRPFTMNLSPSAASMDDDLQRSIDVAKMLGWNLEQVRVDFDEHTIDDIAHQILKMPLAPHTCLGFHVLTKRMSERGISKTFCGQMLDALYMLGATSRISLDQAALAALFRRFYFSDFYLSLVGGFGSHPAARQALAKAAGIPGLLLFQRLKRTTCRLPRDAADLIDIFQSSLEGVVFQVTQEEPCEGTQLSAPDSSFKVYQRMLETKFSGYLKGGGTFAPVVAGDLHGVPVSLPYGSPLLSRFFSRNRVRLRDVVFPKRFVYRLIKELEPGVSALWKPSKLVGGLSGQEWFRLLLDETLFGKTLVETVGRLDRPEAITNGKYFNMHLYAFWIKRATSVARSRGVQVIDD